VFGYPADGKPARDQKRKCGDIAGTKRADMEGLDHSRHPKGAIDLLPDGKIGYKN
jgi:hypothetical protein